MTAFDPDMLQAWTNGKWQGPRRHARITGFAHDTRSLRAGEVFVALRTEKADGHAFIKAAAEAGASAAIVETVDTASRLPQLLVRDALTALQSIAHEHRARFKGKIIGVTGSCGKTSTKDLLKLILGAERTHATAGNLNNLIGVPLTLVGLDLERHAFAVVEAGMSLPDEMARLAWMIEPDLSIVTVIAPAHLEGVGSLDNVAREKAALARGTRPHGRVLIPYSCCEYEAFQRFRTPRLVVVREEEDAIGVEPECCVPYQVEKADGAGSVLKIWRDSRTPLAFAVPAWSPGMMSNAALAITAALELGVSEATIGKGLQEWQPSARRGEILEYGASRFYLDCYNANPVSLLDAVCAFHERLGEASPRLYFLGCMNELGVDAARLHHECGLKIRLRAEDRAILIGPHARALKAGLLAAGATSGQIKIAASVETARRHVLAFQGAVFVKGSRSYALEKIFEKPLPVPTNLMTRQPVC